MTPSSSKTRSQPVSSTIFPSLPPAATFPLREVQAAYERFAAGGKLGKIVLLTG